MKIHYQEERGYDILFNPRFSGKVKIGYNPYFQDSNAGLVKDTNIPSSRLAVKGDINASEKLIGTELNIGKWSISQDSTGCLIFKTSDNTNTVNKLCPTGTQSSISPIGTVIAWSGDYY